jgi:hypothetical protein
VAALQPEQQPTLPTGPGMAVRHLLRRCIVVMCCGAAGWRCASSKWRHRAGAAVNAADRGRSERAILFCFAVACWLLGCVWWVGGVSAARGGADAAAEHIPTMAGSSCNKQQFAHSWWLIWIILPHRTWCYTCQVMLIITARAGGVESCSTRFANAVELACVPCVLHADCVSFLLCQAVMPSCDACFLCCVAVCHACRRQVALHVACWRTPAVNSIRRA